MKKHVILACTFVLFCSLAKGQKYALIDVTLSHPVRYSNTLTTREVQQKLLPLEKKYLVDFLKALEQIKRELNNKNASKQLTNFHFGCTQINGLTVAMEDEKRFNYVITSHCEKVNATFLLCDVKFKNSMNSFIVSTWIKYLKANLKIK